MSYTTTTRLGLKKAVVGSNQAFETAVFNENLDKIDAEFVADDSRLDAVEALNVTQTSRLNVVEPKVTALETLTSSGTVYAATSAVTAQNSLKVDGRKLTVGSSQPSSPTVGDLWIQV